MRQTSGGGVWSQDGRLILEKRGKKGAMVEEPAPVSEQEKKDKYDPFISSSVEQRRTKCRRGRVPLRKTHHLLLLNP
jgi:hypothetical protein